MMLNQLWQQAENKSEKKYEFENKHEQEGRQENMKVLSSIDELNTLIKKESKMSWGDTYLESILIQLKILDEKRFDKVFDIINWFEFIWDAD